MIMLRSFIFAASTFVIIAIVALAATPDETPLADLQHSMQIPPIIAGN